MEVQGIYKKYSEAGAVMLNEGKSCKMSYTVRTVTEDSATDGIAESTIDMQMSKEWLQVKSPQMEVYQDQQDAFVVLPIKKMVMRGDPETRINIDKRTNRLKFIQDTVFSLCKVIACKSVAGKSTTNKTVVLEVNEKGKGISGIKRLSFDINTQTKQFERVKIEYATHAKGFPGKVVYVEYFFHSFSVSDTPLKKNGKAKDLFMVSKNKLNEKFIGYTLVDNRRKANGTMVK